MDQSLKAAKTPTSQTTEGLDPQNDELQGLREKIPRKNYKIQGLILQLL